MVPSEARTSTTNTSVQFLGQLQNRGLVRSLPQTFAITGSTPLSLFSGAGRPETASFRPPRYFFAIKRYRMDVAEVDRPGRFGQFVAFGRSGGFHAHEARDPSAVG